MNERSESDPKYHTEKIQVELEALIDHLRQDINKVEEPQARALFETSAEVLQGLKRAIAHYEESIEKAWQ
jgi:hypothetical protein